MLGSVGGTGQLQEVICIFHLQICRQIVGILAQAPEEIMFKTGKGTTTKPQSTCSPILLRLAGSALVLGLVPGLVASCCQ